MAAAAATASGRAGSALRAPRASPALGGVEHVPVHLRKPDEKPEEWQARCKRRFQVPHIEDAAVEIDVRVIGIDGVDAARNLDMIPGIEKGAEKGDGSKTRDPAAIIRIFDDAEINLLHLRHGSEQVSRREAHEERRQIDRLREITKVLARGNTEAPAWAARQSKWMSCNPNFAQKNSQIEQSSLPPKKRVLDQVPGFSSSTGSTDENSLIAFLRMSRSPSE